MALALRVGPRRSPHARRSIISSSRSRSLSCSQRASKGLTSKRVIGESPNALRNKLHQEDGSGARDAKQRTASPTRLSNPGFGVAETKTTSREHGTTSQRCSVFENAQDKLARCCGVHCESFKGDISDVIP